MNEAMGSFTWYPLAVLGEVDERFQLGVKAKDPLYIAIWITDRES
jgi:hypothetical protein